MSADYVDWTGRSGQKYRYYFGTIAGAFAVSANYAFVKQLSNGNWTPVYFGEAGDLKAWLPGHEKLDEAVRLGATHFMSHKAASEVARRAEERDLIQHWNPPANIQHRTAL